MHRLNSLISSVALLSSFAAVEVCWAQGETPAEHAWKIVESAWNAGPPNHRTIIEGKYRALEAVAEISDPRATAVFREALTGSHPGFRFQAAGLLDPHRTAELLPEIKAVLARERESAIRGSFITAISQLDAGTALPILVPLAKQDGEKVDVDIAVGALMRFGPGASDGYTEILASGCERCREEAAELLLRSGAPDTAVPALRAALASANQRTSLYAAAALAALGDGSGNALLKARLGDAERYQRDVAAVALCQLGDTSGREALRMELHSGDPGRVHDAARSVGRSGLESLRPLLEASLSDASPEVRARALSAIEEGPTGGGEPTAAMLADPDSGVRYLVCRNLLKRGDRQRADPYLGALSKDRDREWMVLDMLAEYGASTDAEQELALKGLHSDSVASQTFAVRALRLAGNGGLTAITPLLESPEPWVVRTVARTLVEISPTDAMRCLEQGMQSNQQHVRILSAGYFLRAQEVLGKGRAKAER